jgi:dihydroneopterin aldolase
MSDHILVEGLVVLAHHGVAPQEKALGQRFELDLRADLDLRPAGQSDDYAATVGYEALIAVAIEAFTAKSHNLIEAAAEAVAAAALTRFPAIERITVAVRKPAAPIEAVFRSVGIVIERSRG